LLAAGGFDGRIRLWDVSDPNNARERPALQPDPASERSIVALAFSSDGSSLVSAGGVALDGNCPLQESSNVFVTDVATGAAALLGSVQGCVSGLAFSPTEQVVASAGSDGTVVLWDVAQRTARATFVAHGDWVTSVAFSPDGTRLATAGRDGLARVWDVGDLTQQTPEPITTFRGHDSVVRTVAFSPDGTMVASGDRAGQVMVWDPKTGKAVRALSASHAGDVFSVAFDPTRPLLASASADQTIVIWTLDGGRAPTTLVAAGLVRALVYDAEQHVMVAAGSRQITGAEEGGEGGIVWSPIGRAGSPEHTVVARPVFALALNPTTGVLASGDADATVTLWDSATRVPLASFERLDVERCGSGFTAPDAVYSLAFDPSGSMLAIGFRSGTIVLMEAPFDADGAVRCTTVDGIVWDLEFSADGKRLAASNGDARALLWNIETDEHTPIVAAAETVTSVAFQPSGALLAIGDNAGGIVLYDLHSNAVVGQSLKGHGSAVKSLRFRPGGAILASASLDGAVILWDIATRLPLTGRLTGNDDATAHMVLSVEWLDKGAALASGGSGGAVLWDFRPASLRAAVCAAANRNLSALEWAAFVGSDRDYRRSCDDRPPGVGAG
jgi:WD40 repeat protein